MNRSEIEGRLDSEYYRPDIAKLEKVIRQKSTKKLADFAYFMASGGTPNVSEENYYSDEKNGIPFLRVQNLTEQGVLDLNGLKYISKDVHENMLKRSQFDDQDLLVKITGVGRMAVASVSPIGFVGNTNQHMIVVKTKNRKISEYLASYLNLNIVEKLAKRHSTGGTRPALDYSALRSIPIIENIDFGKWENAKIQAQSIQKQSQTLLNSISDYLLEKLGITVPKVDNSLNSRIFFVNANDIRGGRLDPYFHNPQLKLSDFKAGFMLLGNAFTSCSGTIFSDENVNKSGIHNQNDIAILRANNIDLRTNSLDFSDVKYLNSDFSINPEHKLLKNDILVCGASGSKNHVGKVAFIKEDLDYYFGGFMFVLRSKTNVFLPEFVFEILASDYFRTFLSKVSGGTNINNLNLNMIKNFKIPLPDMETQKTIVAHIKQIRKQAQHLEQQAKDLLQQTQQEIEKMILGN